MGKKQDDIDYDRVIAPMDAPGMPGVPIKPFDDTGAGGRTQSCEGESVAGVGNAAGGFSGGADVSASSGASEPISRRDRLTYIWGAVKAGLLIYLVFAIAFLAFILFCVFVWMKE